LTAHVLSSKRTSETGSQFPERCTCESKG